VFDAGASCGVMAASKSKTDTPDETEEPEAPKLSKAREKFNAGEITWRELCEAEAAEAT